MYFFKKNQMRWLRKLILPCQRTINPTKE